MSLARLPAVVGRAVPDPDTRPALPPSALAQVRVLRDVRVPLRAMRLSPVRPTLPFRRILDAPTLGARRASGAVRNTPDNRVLMAVTAESRPVSARSHLGARWRRWHRRQRARGTIKVEHCPFVPALPIHLHSDGLKVIRPDAETHPTQVVDFPPVRHDTAEEPVRPDVRTRVGPLPGGFLHGELPVTVHLTNRTSPDPTPIGVWGHARPEPARFTMLIFHR